MPGNSTNDVAARKGQLRARVLAVRDAIGEGERRRATADVIQRLEALCQGSGFRTVAAYAATGSEIVIDEWLASLQSRGVEVFLPFVDGDDIAITRVYSLEDDLRPGWRGVREPTRRRPARADRVDAFIVPGAAFDPAGNRLGYGGGHFDRLLTRAGPRATFVGVAFDVQVVASVPSAPHDVRMHHVVSDRRWLPVPLCAP